MRRVGGIGRHVIELKMPVTLLVGVYCHRHIGRVVVACLCVYMCVYVCVCELTLFRPEERGAVLLTSRRAWVRLFVGKGGWWGEEQQLVVKVGKVRKEKRKKGSLIRCGIP